jgi:hypothetical protein
MLASEMVMMIAQETGDFQLADLPYNYISQIIEELDGMGYWRCLERNPPVQISTTAPHTTGTLTATTGSTTITGAAASFTSGMVGQVLRISGEEPYYFINAVDTVAQTLTLEGEYVGTGGSGLSYSIYYVNYSLGTELAPHKIKSILIQNTHRKLMRLDDSERDEKWSDLLQTVTEPFWYLTWGESSIQVLPVPNAAYSMLIRGQKIPRAVSASQTTIDFPSRMHQCIFFGALALAWGHKDDDNRDGARKTFESMAVQHFQLNNRSPDYVPRLERFTAGSKTNKLQSRMGSTISGSGPYS